MTDSDLQHLMNKSGIAPWRIALARWVESPRVQHSIIALIILNAAILGMEATPLAKSSFAPWMVVIDHVCLGIFVIELMLKAAAYRWAMLRSGWNVFDLLVVGIALVPASGPASVLRGLRVLRVFRLLTAVPSMRKVVAAFLHAIPGLSSVMALMSVFFYVAGVMATGFFGASHPEWFGHLGQSLYTLFQVMTLESWSMGIVRPVMETHPWAWAFFLPFIIMATFTILNLFIGIIVSTMQELAATPGGDGKPVPPPTPATELLARLERDIAELRRVMEQDRRVG
jgi:voltage-gated sodium channel